MAQSVTTQNLKTALATADTSPVLLLDVRREPVFEAAPDRIAGSSWRDPGEVGAWGAELPQNVPIVVYCVHGHQVSQGVAAQLVELGYDARYLEGGIEAWRETGGATSPAS